MSALRDAVDAVRAVLDETMGAVGETPWETVAERIQAALGDGVAVELTYERDVITSACMRVEVRLPDPDGDVELTMTHRLGLTHRLRARAVPR